MIKILINDEEVVSNKTIEIKEELLSTSSAILNNCYPKSWDDDRDYVSRLWFPKDFSNCKILKDDNLLFSGIVKNTGNILLNPRMPKYTAIQVVDYKTLLSDGKTLDYVINNKTIKEAVKQVIQSVSDYGFVEGNIEIDDTSIIGAYSTLDKTAYDVLQYLAELCNGIWYTRVLSDNSVAIDFYQKDKLPRADNIEYTQDYFENNDIVDITYSYSGNDYRNKQVILSDEVVSSNENMETLIYDGTSEEIELEQNIGKLTSIMAGGEEASIGTEEEKSFGIYADFYYKVGESKITVNKKYAQGTFFLISYYSLVKGRQIVSNESEINRITNQINRNGEITRYENRNDVVSSEELEKIAQTYITFKGKPEITLTIKTSNKDLFNIGQQVYFDIEQLDELQQDYMVKTKTTQIIAINSTYQIFYTYELSSTYNGDQAINYFDNQRRKAEGNITGSDFITRNIDYVKNIGIVFSNLTITEQPKPTAGNILNCTLNAPFTK